MLDEANACDDAIYCLVDVMRFSRSGIVCTQMLAQCKIFRGLFRRTCKFVVSCYLWLASFSPREICLIWGYSGYPRLG